MTTWEALRRISIACPALALVIVCPLATAGALPSSPEWEADRRLSRNGAKSQTSINFARSLAADERGRVHVVWADERNGDSEVYYKRSIDGGLSWGPPVRLTEAPGVSNNPSVAVEDDAVHVVWWDTRDSLHQIFHKRSRDGGATWSADRPITASPGGAAHPSLALAAGRVHVVYVDGRHGPDRGEVYTTRSIDGGATWEEAGRLSALPWNSYTPTVAAWEDQVYVAWTDTRDQQQESSLEEEYFRRSLDGGASWEEEARLTFDPANSWAPSLAAEGSEVWIVWFDQRGGDWEIYTKRSTDQGATWSPDRRLTHAAGESQRPVIARQEDALYVVWWDTRDGIEEIYGISSSNRGATWSEPERLTTHPSGSLLPAVAAAASGVHVVWTDGRDGNPELYYKRLAGEPVAVANGRIALTRQIEGQPQIFTVDATGGDERQLTFEGANNYPAWSKDGGTLAFTSNRGGFFELWRMNADGSGQALLTSGTPGDNFVPDWSHDGTRLAYASLHSTVGHSEIWTVNADGSESTRLTFLPSGGTGGSVHPSWSPGDERIYYGSGAEGGTQIWGMFADGQGQERKTPGLGPGFPEANVPEFARTGETFVFWSGIEGQFGEVWSWDLTRETGPRRLTETPDPRNSDNPSWSPDGTQILFDTNRSGTGSEIWVMAADGSDPRPLISGDGQVSWQPVTAGDAGGGGSGGSGGEPFACVPSENELCLAGERFEVRVTWRDFKGADGPGRVVRGASDDSGLFWFFNEENWELLVKVLNGCPANGHYWVFAAATTNVAYTLTVTDSHTGEVSEYRNPLGTASPAITDTRALATCL